MLNKKESNMNTNKLDRTQAELVILKLEFKKLSIDLEIVTEQYAHDLINKERFDNHIDSIIQEQTYKRGK